VRLDLMSDGSEFHVRGATVQKAHFANSVLVLGTDSSGASRDHRGRTGTAGWIRSLRCACCPLTQVQSVSWLDDAGSNDVTERRRSWQSTAACWPWRLLRRYVISHCIVFSLYT